MESEDDVGLLIPDLLSPTSGRTADENPMPSPPSPGGGIGMGIVSVEAGVSTRGNAPTGGVEPSGR